MAASLPLWQQVLVVLLVPPIMATLFAIMARGWAGTVAGVLGKKVSATTRSEQAWEFWFVLIFLYVGCIGMFIYAHVWR